MTQAWALCHVNVTEWASSSAGSSGNDGSPSRPRFCACKVWPLFPIFQRQSIWVLLPGILFAAISYEGSGFLLGPSLYLRTRLPYAVCAGAAVLVLAVGATFTDSNPHVLLVAVVVFIAVWFVGSLPVVVRYRALLRRRDNPSVVHTH
jgi:hypothetical protein